MKFLLEHFIKNYNDISDLKVRTQYGKLGAWIGIGTNLILILIKLFAGIVAGSIALIGSAVDSIADTGSSIVTLIGFKVAAKPADAEHPYGHQRIEYIAGFIIAVVIIIVAVELGINSVNKIITPTAVTYNVVTIIILGVSILLKLWQCYAYHYLAKQINSLALAAASTDARNDVITTAAILAGALVGMFTDFNIDGYLGLLVAIFVLISGIELIKDAINPLIGVAPDKKLVHNVIKDIKKHPEVLGVHDFVIHSYGENRTFASIHVEVDGQRDIFESHDMIDVIEHEIKTKYNIELVIHMDPIVTGDVKLDELKDKVGEILTQINPALRFHDFRMVKGTTHSNLIFDVVVPNDVKIERSELYAQIRKGIKAINSTYEVVINFDNDYIGED